MQAKTFHNIQINVIEANSYGMPADYCQKISWHLKGWKWSGLTPTYTQPGFWLGKPEQDTKKDSNPVL